MVAFNGLNGTCSNSSSFELCEAGDMESPYMYPESHFLVISNLSLSWSINWNDDCGETHIIVVTIVNDTKVLFTSGELSETETSLAFTESEMISMGFTDWTYSWTVYGIKGTQTISDTKTFVYCIPAPEAVSLNIPGFPLIVCPV